MKALTTTPMPEPNDPPRVVADRSGSASAPSMLAPHDLARGVVRDAIRHVGEIGRAKQCAAPVLAVAHEQIGARPLLDRRIGEQIDPQPRRTARHEREAETIVMRWDIGKHGLELSLE